MFSGHVESAQQKGDQEDMEFVNTDKGMHVYQTLSAARRKTLLVLH